MAIQIKRGDLLRREGRLHVPAVKLAPVPSPAATPAAEVSIDTEGVTLAIRELQADMRTALAHALANNETVAAAITAFAETHVGPWNCRILKRDALGRIEEVRFERTPQA